MKFVIFEPASNASLEIVFFLPEGDCTWIRSESIVKRDFENRCICCSSLLFSHCKSWMLLGFFQCALLGYCCCLSYPSLHLVSYLDRKNMFLTFTEDNAFVTLWSLDYCYSFSSRLSHIPAVTFRLWKQDGKCTPRWSPNLLLVTFVAKLRVRIFACLF